MADDDDDNDAEPAIVGMLGAGDPDPVAADGIAAGGDIRYRRAGGYDALIDAVHHRDVARDPRLLDLLARLVAAGAPLDGESVHGESALSVLSRLGRFDAVRLLLDAGADPAPLRWTPLIEAVALGARADVEALVRAGAPLEATDRWQRTAWLVALLAGDLGKAELLRAAGASTDARARGGRPALFHAIAGHHPEIVRWLLDTSADAAAEVERTNDFGTTPLMEAVDEDDGACAGLLIAAGADVDRASPTGSALHRTASRAMVERLLAAGADPAELAFEGQRALLGMEAPPAVNALATVTPADFARARTRAFGTANPQRMHEPFWEAMIRDGIGAYAAGRLFAERGAPAPAAAARAPIWCAQRFGQSITFLPDGRVVQIGGEHEDYYDADFCIYNDVFVHHPAGAIAIYGYPASVFPPTDFHTATLAGDAIYVIGSGGYPADRRPGETPVYRLDVASLRFERLAPTGDAPGWIHRHRATPVGPPPARAIRISGGKLPPATADPAAALVDNLATFTLELATLTWHRDPVSR